MNTPYSIAWNKFSQSQDFNDITDPETLGAGAEQRKYLENRLRTAFEAGWNAKTSSILETLERQFGEKASRG